MNLNKIEPEEGSIKVKRFICKCGKTRLLAVIDPMGKPFSKESMKEQTKMLKANLDVETITLDEARKSELCFDCEL